MNSAIIVLIEEKQRLERAKKLFSREIAKLPKGSLQLKKRASQYFYYRVFRDENNKHTTVYIGKKDSKEVIKTQELIQERKELEQKFRKVKKDLNSITRLIPKNER